MSRSTLLRSTALVGLVGAAVVAGPSSAAPASCNLIKDAAGDGNFFTASDDLDIVGGDVASDGKTVTGVIRLAGDPAATNPEAVLGKQFYISFIATGSANPQFLSASFDPVAGQTFGTGETVVTAGAGQNTSDAEPVKGKVAGNEITITAPVGAFAGRVSIKKDSKLTGLAAETFAVIGSSVAPVSGLRAADDATGGTYTVGSASCVKAV